MTQQEWREIHASQQADVRAARIRNRREAIDDFRAQIAELETEIAEIERDER